MNLRPQPPQNNIGSVARDHLANERTFLAWVRTALAVIGLGVLLGKLVETDGLQAELLGLTMVAFGAAMLVYSVRRYEQVARSLSVNTFVPARWGPIVLAALGALVAIGSMFMLLI